MSKPDVLTVVAGQMVTYHNEPALPVRFAIPDKADMTEAELSDLMDRIGDASLAGRVESVLTPDVAANLSRRDMAKVCGWLVALLDAKL